MSLAREAATTGLKAQGALTFRGLAIDDKPAKETVRWPIAGEVRKESWC